MNKAELKKFAVEARRELLEKVSLKAEQYGINKDNEELKIEENYGQLFVNGKPFPTEMKQAFHTLKQRLNVVGYNQLIEEVAYTWFNRIIAIRYMEVNNYLPDRVNVLSSNTGKSEPDILLQFETMNLDVDHQQIKELLQRGENEQAYRKLFIAQCNSLNKLLPFLFEKIDNYTELLLPDYLLDQESIVRKIVNDLSDGNFYQIKENGSRSDNVEVLGWLYQYYMSEKKEQVGGLRNNAVKKEDLPVVTQLFTPKWIVQYMLQNSLGKLYDEKYEDNQLAKAWEYYLKHEENHRLYPDFESLEDLKLIDPACGSGHILLYAFEMLYDMYEEAGYPSSEIPQLIIENNLYGLDIDKRAQQIANFALLMKAAEKQPRFLSRLSRKGLSPKLNVYEIVDVDKSLSKEAIDYFTENETEKSLINELLSQFENGKQFGSLINSIEIPYEEWINRIEDLEKQKRDLLDVSYLNEIKDKLLPVIKQAFLLYQKYDVIVTNPPYHSKYNPILKKFMISKYEKFKSDLYSAFVYRTIKMSKLKGYIGLMTPFTWMFISRHEELRDYLLRNSSISNLVQLEYSAFEEATVPICSFIIQNQTVRTKGNFIRLSDFNGASNQPIKVKEAVKNPKVPFLYRSDNTSFMNIPSSPIAYWLTETEKELFKEEKKIGDIYDAKGGMTSGNNDLFLRLWHEVSFNKMGVNLTKEEAIRSDYVWFPYNKGGSFRKWYGNRSYVINWYRDGSVIKNYKQKQKEKNPNYNSAIAALSSMFKPQISWSLVTSSSFSARFYEKGFLFDVSGSSVIVDDKDNYLLGLLNSVVAKRHINVLNPTMNYQPGNIKNLIYKKENDAIISNIVEENIELSRKDWDSNEISWDFSTHPFINIKKELPSVHLKDIYDKHSEKTSNRFNQLKSNEEKLNELFIDIFGLRDIHLSSKVENEEVTINLANRDNDTRSFLSYFIGCVMGRYSLDNEGIVHAGQEPEESKYKTFKPNQDGLIQLTDENYFENDIIATLREFLSKVFSPDTTDENIQWLADSLEMKRNESPEERLRRYFIDEFFKDHCKMYQNRPIYWLVDSGKQKGLRTLIYMHRYQADTMATIRFEHLQEIQSKYHNEIEMIDTRLANPSLSPTDKRSLEKSKASYQKKIEELQEFDKKLATYANEQIDIDLDDGVKVNYAKFNEVLAKIK